MGMRKKVQDIQPENTIDEPVLLVERVERLLSALAGHLSEAAAVAPPEPCGEAHVHDVPIDQWRLLIDRWCTAELVRRAHGVDLVTGLSMAVRDFDDEELADFLLRMV